MPTDVTHGWVGVERLETARQGGRGADQGLRRLRRRHSPWSSGWVDARLGGSV